MTRIISYNILAGGYNSKQGTRRTHQLIKIISSVQPDIVGLVEAVNPRRVEKPLVIEEIAESLGMQLIISRNIAQRRWDYPVALLTRLPVVYTKVHFGPDSLVRPLLEVCLEEANGQQLTVFLIHLSASFNHGWAGNHLRQREMQEILRITAPIRTEGKPHILMGDFNTLSPGDAFKASFLLRYVLGLDIEYSSGQRINGLPHLSGIVPRRLRFLYPLLQTVPKSVVLSGLFDTAASFYAPRGPIRSLQKLYKDCFRYLHPRESGYTYPATIPAGRIDYIFASPILANRLTNCYVVTEGEGMPADRGSDHLPVAAEFN